jgi:hypothetical protein
MQKNKPSRRGKFSTSKTGQQRTTIHHETTTNSPSKNHVLPRHFLQNPSQNPSQNHKNSLQKK